MTISASGRHRRPPEPTGPRILVAVVQVLGLAVWFSASAVLPALRAEWGIGAAAGVWLTLSVQLGFVVGAVVSAVLTLADRVRPERLLAGSAAAAATCTLLLAAIADGPVVALLLRLLTGVFLAGVYPVGMKIMTSWSGPRRRARDLGMLVGALTLGSAMPHLFSGVGGLSWRGVLAGAALAGFAAAALAWTVVRPGPAHAPAPPPDPGYAVRMLREPGPRLVVLGYLGHMWELYALWTWLDSALSGGRAGPGEHLLVFVAAGVGGAAGCLLGGRAADRYGRVPVIATALAVSGACCLASPLLLGAAPAVVTVFCVVWGAAAVADSAVLTTATLEVADPRYPGTALTVQTALGFLLTVVAIATVPLVAGVVGWQAALVVLAAGPALGLPAVLALRRHLPAAGAGAPGARTAVAPPAATRAAEPATEPLPQLYRLRRIGGPVPDPGGLAGPAARALPGRGEVPHRSCAGAPVRRAVVEADPERPTAELGRVRGSGR